MTVQTLMVVFLTMMTGINVKCGNVPPVCVDIIREISRDIDSWFVYNHSCFAVWRIRG